MHDDFSDWYRPCTAGTEINLTGDLLAKRWEGVEKAAESSRPEVLNMVRLALGRPGVSAAFLDKFKAAFKEADATFQMSGNDLELSVLAGSTLCRIFTEDPDDADNASLGLICAVSIAKGPEWSEPFVSHAERYLDGRLRNLRKPTEVRRPQLPTKKLKQLFDIFTTRLAENEPALIGEASKQMFEALLQAMKAVTEEASAAIEELDTQSNLRRQETDVLWWLTAGVSRDTGMSFKDITTAAASIVAGKELADLVNPPGVLPAKSILKSVIPPAVGKAAGKPVSLHTAVNATEREWRRTVVGVLKIDQVADLCPLLAAIKHSLTTDEADGWTGAYKKAYRVDPKTALQPVEMAHEIHRECLLARLAAEE